MSLPEFDPQRLEELLLISANQSLSETDRTELNALLRANAQARTFAARSLTLDALLMDFLAAAESQQSHATATQSTRATQTLTAPKPTSRLARAAAWIGAFHLFSNTAKATSIILMKKAVCSITAAILVLGGSGIYAIHRHNESSKERVVNMETEIQSLSNRLGIKTTGFSNRTTGATNGQKTVSVVRVLAIYGGDNKISMQENAILDQFKKQLAAMDADSLKSLLLDADKISSPIHGRVAEMIMAELVRKDPAEATQIANQLIGSGFGFQFLLSASAAKAFKAWLDKDPAAANAWYVATAAAGGFNGKSIAPNGLEEFAIDRSFARLRFAAQVLANPTEAAAMLAAMLPADVTDALQEVTDPEALRRILPKLKPEQRIPAAEGAIKVIAANDPNAAFSWAQSLGMGDRERDTLMTSGIVAAVDSGKLDLAGVSEWSKKLNLDSKRRSEMHINAAVNASRVPGDDKRVADWDRVAERTAWLRKEAPPGLAGRMVGEYLGRLTTSSRNPDPSIKAYQQEVAGQASPDPSLTIAFASHLGLMQLEPFSDQALKVLKELPASQERDNAIEIIEINR